MKRHIQNGEGVRAFAKNLIYNALDGPTWESGLQVTPNTTDTSGIFVDIGDGAINVDGEPISHPSQKIELSAAENYPYIAVIDVTTAGVGKVEGNEAPKRPNSTQDDTEGTFPNIWSPVPDDGGLVNGVGRALVYVRPSVSDSTDITDADIRNYNVSGLNAVSVDDLRGVIEALDTSSESIDTSVRNSDRLGGEPGGRIQRNYFTVNVPAIQQQIPGTQATDPFLEKRVVLPPGHRFRIWRTSLISDMDTNPGNISIQAVRYTDSGIVEMYSSGASADYDTDGFSPLFNSAAGFGTNQTQQTLGFRVRNDSDTQQSGAKFSATFLCDMMDSARD